MKRTFITLLMPATMMAATLFQSAAVCAQVTNGTTKAAANTGYNQVSGFKKLVLGHHYRKEWGTVLDIPILDLDKAGGGGLTPLKMGGGMQTKSLRLRGADGKEYVLRSVNKDPSKALVAELRETFAEDVVQDQISSSNPYAPLVVASLAEAAGIFHSTPLIVYIPHSRRLGEFENIFAETLCLFEERPSGDGENNPAYGFSKKIVNSEKLLEKVFSNSNHQVDETAFVKARLFDMLIGDWDRHEDQWLWASFEVNDQTIYKPIPRDRDQAFIQMDGVIPFAASRKWALRRIQHFDYHIRDVNGLNMSGGFLDRNFTTRLTAIQWQGIAKELQQALTDDVIDAAFRLMPEPIYKLSGEETKARLKQRRNDLLRYAHIYYRFLARQVTITGTEDKEIFTVMRINNDSTRVMVQQAGSKAGKNKVVYDRVFLNKETKEIRLYGLEGKDDFNIQGEVGKGILIRVMGGPGADTVTDRSMVHGAAHRTKIYDDRGTVLHTGKEARAFLSSDSIKNTYNRKSFRYDLLSPVIRPGYNPDDGIYIGGGFTFKKQQFGKAPFGYLVSVGGNYAFKTGAYNFWYEGLFKEGVGKWDLNTAIQINAPNFSRNYFGPGNETERVNTKRNYYRVRFNQIIGEISLRREFKRKHVLDAGIGFQSVRVERNDDRFISTLPAKLDSSDFGRKHYGTAHLAYQYSSVNNMLYPRKGVVFRAGADLTQNLREKNMNFARLFSEVSVYASLRPVTIALRAGVASNLNNKYEFFQANTIGNFTNLRGFRKDRFAGKTSVYQNTEIRCALGYANAYIVKGSWGLLGFVDNGRVWIPGENSNTWHVGYGGGIWFLPFNKLAFTGTIGLSKEDQVVSIGTGFMF